MSVKHWNDRARRTAHALYPHCSGHAEHDGGHVSECDEMTLCVGEKLQSQTYRDDVRRELTDVRGLLSDLMTMVYDTRMHSLTVRPAYMRAFAYLETLKVPDDEVKS